MSEKKRLVRIRGIYATALTKIFTERSFSPTQPTKPIISRFSIEEPVYDPPSVTIKDRADKKALVLIGEPEAVDETIKILREELVDPIVRIFKPNLGAIYKGVVEESRQDGVVVELGDFKGFLPNKFYSEGEHVLVCVRKPSLKPPALLSEDLTIIGKYLKLIKNQGISISRHITDPGKRKDLLYLSKIIKPNGWGIRWRSSARYASLEQLIDEAEMLKKKIEDLMKKAEKSSAPSLISDGEKVAEVILTLDDRLRLDEIRGTVCPTTPLHHYVKSMDNQFLNNIVEFCDTLSAKVSEKRALAESLFDYSLDSLIAVGQMITIQQEYVTGDVHTIRGRLVERDGRVLVVEREFKAGGTYDALQLPIEEGDRGLTFVELHAPVVYHFYFSKDGNPKGVYANINTPVEIAGHNKLWYLDLEIDVVKNCVTKVVKIVDEDKFKELVEGKHISEKLAQRVNNVVESVRTALSNLNVTSFENIKNSPRTVISLIFGDLEKKNDNKIGVS